MIPQDKIEAAARGYASKNDGGSDPRYCGLEDGFTVGAQWAQEEILKGASEGFGEWFKENFSTLVKHGGLAKMESDAKEAWQAARLSAQKEVNKLIDGAAKDNERIEGLVGTLRDIANDKSPPWDKTDYQSLARQALATFGEQQGNVNRSMLFAAIDPKLTEK